MYNCEKVMASSTIDGFSDTLNKPCRRCGKIAQSGLKCVVCNITSHNSCVALMKNVSFIGDKSIVCCDKVDVSVKEMAAVEKNNNNVEVSNNEIFYLKLIIEQKDVIIKNQSDLIDSLKDQISLLKKTNILNDVEKEENCKKTATPLPMSEKSNFRYVTKNCTKEKIPEPECSIQNKDTTTEINNKNEKRITAEEVSAAIKQSQAKLTAAMLTKENNNTQDENVVDDGFTQVRSKRKRKPNTIKGSNDIKSSIEGVEKYEYVYVGHIKGNKDINALEDYMKNMWPKQTFKIKKLENKGNNSSFMVGVAQSLKKQIYDPTKWPQGIIVKDYVFFRKRMDTTQKGN